jgi:hypothetical protein
MGNSINPVRPKIADRKRYGIPGHEPNLWIWYRLPGIPDFTSILDLIREERILSAILGSGLEIGGQKKSLETSQIHHQEEI